MKVIKFGSASYDLVDSINVHGTRFQATIYKGVQSVEQIAANVTGVSEIKLLDENGDLLGVYNGYTDRVAISLQQIDNVDTVSIELERADVAEQVASIAETVELQNAAITDVADEVSSLADSQAVQDTAIEDLAAELASIEPTA